MIREKRRKQKKRKKVLTGLLVCLFAAAAAFLIAVKVFTLKKVVVSGNELYTDQQIKESVLNDQYAWNTLYVVLKHRLFQMKEIPFIDEMEIELRSPHTIHVRVYEKAIIGYIAVNNQNVYFDKDGIVVEISKRQIDHVPKVEGISCREVLVYEKLDLNDEKALFLLLTFSQQMEKYDLSPESILFNGNQNLSAVFDGITVELGSSEYLIEKAMRLDAIMPRLKGKKGTLHLENWTPLTTDVVFAPEK